jgi:pimeloyl-ACP methyl ester carboxylesterase
MTITQTFTSRDGMKIAYYVDDFTDPWTRPETLFLLHAAMGNARRWFRWVPQLARRYRVVRMELRGHGASQKPRPDQDFSLALLVSDALELLDRLEVKSAHVVGNSAGGYVSQQLAIHHGERVRALALYGSTPGLKHSHASTWIPIVKERGLKKFLADTIYERFDESADPGLVQWFIEQAGSNDPEFIARFVLHMTTHDFMEDVARISCPTMIVAAGKEQIGHASAYADMQKRIAGSELKLYDTAGHNICDGYADRCVADLLDFLGRRSPR